MADLKISALTAGTTPLAGTEVLPIVQSSTTKKISVDNLTAGKTVPAKQVNITSTDTAELHLISTGSQEYIIGSTGTSYGDANKLIVYLIGVGELSQYNTSGDFKLQKGNVVVGTSGKGIDFSATSHPAGMTSELLADYEEGTWTPLLSDGTNNATMDTGSTLGTYTKIGNLVNLRARVITTALGSVSGNLIIKGLPYTIANNGSNYGGGAAGAGQNFLIVAGQSVALQTLVGGTTLSIQVWGNTGGSTSMTSTEWTSDGDLFFNINYYV